MNRRKLGKTGLEIAPLVFGGNVFGWTADQKVSFQLLDAFFSAGFNSVDTADVYSKWAPGHTGVSESGNHSRRMDEAQRKPRRSQLSSLPRSACRYGRRKKRSVEDAHPSLRGRLAAAAWQTDYIDLYQSHLDDPDTPFEETLGAYADLMKQGKVRAIGASNHKAERLAAALEASRKHGLPAYQTLQPNYSLDRARGLRRAASEPICVKEGLGVIDQLPSPLAAGFLTGKYRSEAGTLLEKRGPVTS